EAGEDGKPGFLYGLAEGGAAVVSPQHEACGPAGKRAGRIPVRLSGFLFPSRKYAPRARDSNEIDHRGENSLPAWCHIFPEKNIEYSLEKRQRKDKLRLHRRGSGAD